MAQHATIHGTDLVPMKKRLLCLPCLPVEIINMVAERAGNADVNNLRLTCKQIRVAILPEYVNRYFRERSHVVSPFGMESLEKITADEQFGPCVKTVIFNITTDSNPFANSNSVHSFVNQDKFTELIKKILSNIARNQKKKNYKITIGFTDSFPCQERESCSNAIYRIAEKASYGWYDLPLNKRAIRPPNVFAPPLASRRRFNPRSLGMITMGDLMSRIIPLAIESDCSILGLEVRFVGRLHYTSRNLSVHSPTVHHTLDSVKTPADWNFKISVLDRGRTELSTITHTTADKKLKFYNFCLGFLDIGHASAYAYHVMYTRVAREFDQLEMINCYINKATVMVEQLEELVGFEEICSPVRLEDVVIDGAWVSDNLDWDQIFMALSQMKTVKRCVVRGLSIAPKDEDEEDEDHGHDEDGDGDVAEGEDVMDETVEDDAGETDSGKPDPKKELARLTQSLAGVSMALNEACGHNLSKELLDVAAELAKRT